MEETISALRLLVTFLTTNPFSQKSNTWRYLSATDAAMQQNPRKIVEMACPFRQKNHVPTRSDRHGMHSQLDRRGRNAVRNGVCGRNGQRPHHCDGRRPRCRQPRQRRPKPRPPAHGNPAGRHGRLHRLRRGADSQARAPRRAWLQRQAHVATGRGRPQGVHRHPHAVHRNGQGPCARRRGARHRHEPRKILLGQHHAGQDGAHHHRLRDWPLPALHAKTPHVVANARHSPSHGGAFRLDAWRFEMPFGRGQKPLSL